MKALLFTIRLSYLFCFLAAAWFLAMMPEKAVADCAQITPNGSSFSPDGESTPVQVLGATIFVGDCVEWRYYGLSGTPVSVTANTTQGDYQGHTCPEPGGLNGLLITHEDVYRHIFTTAGDC